MTTENPDYALFLRFLGVGNAFAHDLGNSSCLLERGDEPRLMVDCGPLGLDAYDAHYGDGWPPNLFITHLHQDHIGGLEQLFFRVYLAFGKRAGPKLFVPTHLIHTLHEKMATATHTVAEGGVNWWDMFQLVPVTDHFWLDGFLFRVFPVRHFAHNSAFGLCLPGSFLYTGDTRPIPEVLACYAPGPELIFHDADLVGNPAHSGVDELAKLYPADVRKRLRIYHYADEAAAAAMAAQGFTVVGRGERFELGCPQPFADGPGVTEAAAG